MLLLFFSACFVASELFLLWFFSPVKEGKNKRVGVTRGRSIQVWFRDDAWAPDHVIGRVGGWGWGGKWGSFPPSLCFTRWCCSPGLCTECPPRCSPSPAAWRRTCPRTSRCPFFCRGTPCTATKNKDTKKTNRTGQCYLQIHTRQNAASQKKMRRKNTCSVIWQRNWTHSGPSPT